MQNMNERPVCHRAEDLVAYLYGEANEVEARDFADHLQSCEACRTEFAGFQLVHQSISQWRDETLGASLATAGAVNPDPIAAGQFVHHEQKLSAIAAVREFFSVAPLWLRGATAFAGLLLCLFALVVIFRPGQRPAEITATMPNQEKIYTAAEFNQAVNEAVQKKLAESSRPADPSQLATQSKPERQDRSTELQATARDKAGKGSRARSQRPYGLTPAEREQLAADLRLVSAREDDELPFVFSDEPNQ